MKAAYLEKPGSLKIREILKPRPAPGEALVRVKAAGICGSDIAAYRGTNPLINYPLIIGHEISGEIIEIDKSHIGLSKGTHVIVDPYFYCGSCYPCSIGRTNCCENLRIPGIQIDGDMKEYITHPADKLIPVPKDIAWEDICLAEPLTIALHAIHRTGVKKGEYITINGAGAIGILAALSVIVYGATPILVDIVEERLALARKFGISETINIDREDALSIIRKKTKGRMSEVVIEASGSNSAIRNTLDMVSHAGRIALTGWPKKETLLPTSMITKKELDIYGSRTSAGEFEEAIKLIMSKKVDAGAIISKVIPLDLVPAIVKEQSQYPNRYLKIIVSV